LDLYRGGRSNSLHSCPVAWTYGPLAWTYGPLAWTYGPLAWTYGPLAWTNNHLVRTCGTVAWTCCTRSGFGLEPALFTFGLCLPRSHGTRGHRTQGDQPTTRWYYGTRRRPARETCARMRNGRAGGKSLWRKLAAKACGPVDR
jgi:hypothetical protein